MLEEEEEAHRRRRAALSEKGRTDSHLSDPFFWSANSGSMAAAELIYLC